MLLTHHGFVGMILISTILTRGGFPMDWAPLWE